MSDYTERKRRYVHGLEAENERLRAFVERRAKPSLIGCKCPCHEEAAELLAVERGQPTKDPAG